MGSSLVGMRSLRVSPRRSVASGFYCSVNRAGKKTVHATHVERTKKLGRFNQKRLCRKACGSPVPASPHRIQQRDVRREERPGSGWRVFFSAAAESNLKILCFFFFFLTFLFHAQLFFFFFHRKERIIIIGVIWIDRQMEWDAPGQRQKRSSMTCFIPGHRSGTRLSSLWKLPSQTETGSHLQEQTYSLSF